MDNIKLIHNFKGHSDKAWNVAWNHKGKLLASCGSDKVIHIWDKEGDKFQCKFTLEGSHTRTIRSVAWSICDQHIAAAGFDGITSLWSCENGIFISNATLEGHENEVKSVDWSASGQYIATCSRDKSVWIWEVDHLGEYECCEVMTDHSQDVKCIKWNPCEDTLASSSYDNTIKMYAFDEEDWSCHDTLVSHTSTVWSICFNERGDQLASASDDKTVKVWQRYLPGNDKGIPVTSLAKWKCFCTIDGQHERVVYSISWDWTSGLIATGCGDDFVRIFRPNYSQADCTTYDLYACSEPQSKGHDVNSVSWRPDKDNKTQRQLASCDDDGHISIWMVTVE